MVEIKKTLTILKTRWPEVTLIIGVGLLPVFTSMLLRVECLKLMRNFGGLHNIFSLLILITLRSGFLRTVYLEGQKRQSVAVLLRTGNHFLWRMIVLGALYIIPIMMLTMLKVRWFSPESIRFLNRLLPVAVNIILIKFILLIPALVIVLDCRAFESFRFLKKCRLRDVRELVVLFYFNIALGFLWSLLRTFGGFETSLVPILRIAYFIATGLINLAIVVTAVRFVASGVSDEEFDIPKEY